ncbi:MAG TPA: protein kinase [Candidatus Krumholzibacteria bacterium]
MPLTPGTRLGPHEIVSPLGAGGMGEVYRARDTRLGRDVAIKALPENFAQDPERLARFEREAKVLASLSHPNIAGIFGIEEASGARFLVLEFVDGETLAQRLSRGALPVDEAIDVCRDIAAAVETAHEAGVVHRDLKPGNVMLTPDGKVKVLDFGLARSGGSERSGSDLNLTSSPTRTYQGTQAGVVLGTAAYMSPEQARGKSVDRRTDIWSFGCVLFECLTGKPLFDGETVSDLIAKILQTEPDWSRLPAETPARVRALLKRCLRRDAKERLRDIGDARLELSEIIAGGGDVPAAAAPTARASSGLWRWVAIAAGVVAVASVAMMVTKKPAPASLVRLDLVSPDPAVPIHFLGNFAISPDGRSVAFIMSDKDNVDRVVVRDLDKPALRTLEGTEGVVWPFWSPDSRHIGFFSEGKLRRIPAAGGGVQVLCDVPSARGGAWGDGEIVFAPDAVSPLYRVADNGGTPTVATALDSTRGETSHRFPTFLPDGRHFVFGAQSSSDDRENTIRIGSLEGPEVRILPVRGLCATFAPPGYVLFVRDRAVMAQRVDLKTFEPRGAAVLLDTECNTTPRTSGAPLGSASRNGVLVLGTGYTRPSRLDWHYLDGRVEPGPVMDQVLLAPSISPDGNRAALMKVGTGRFTTFVADLRTGSVTRVGQADAGIRTAVWDPQGNRLAGLSVNGGRNEIRMFDLGSGTDSLVVDSHYEWGVTTSWNEKAGVMFFSPLVEGRGMDIRYVTMTGTRAMKDYLATKANEGAPALSPDGHWIAYWSDATGTFDLVVDRFPTPAVARRVQTKSTAGGVVWNGQIWWSADGRSLVYQRAGDAALGMVDVRFEPALALGEPRQLMNLSEDAYGIDYDAPRQRFLVAAPVGTPRSSLVVIQNWQRQLDSVN